VFSLLVIFPLNSFYTEEFHIYRSKPAQCPLCSHVRLLIPLALHLVIVTIWLLLL